MSDSNTTRNSGTGLLGWLTLLFIFLKLNPGQNFTTPLVDWSWWWVLAPTLIPLAILLAVLLVLGVVWFVLNATEGKRARRRKATMQKILRDRRLR